VKKHARIYRFF